MFRRHSAVDDDAARDADGNLLVDRRGRAAVDTDHDGFADLKVPAEGVEAEGVEPVRYSADTHRSDPDSDMPAVAPVATTDTEPAIRPSHRWAHVSLMATLSLIVGTAAALAVLSGALAPLGVVAGGVAVLLSLLGFSMVRRNGVTGHSIAMLGLLLGGASIVVGLLAINGNLSWLAQDTNGVTRLNDWLAANIEWLTNW